LRDVFVLLISILTGSAAVLAVVVCLFSRAGGGPSWLVLYAGWLVSALLLLMARSVWHFAGFISGPAAEKVRARLPFLSLLLTALFFGATGYYTWQLAARYRRIEVPLRIFLAAGLACGFVLLLLEGVAWLRPLAFPRVPEPVILPRVIFLLVFLGATVSIGRSYLHRKGRKAETVPETIPGGYSEQEQTMIRLIRRGASNAEVAEQLGLNLSQVKNRLYKLYRRSGVNSRGEFLLFLDQSESSGSFE
jgi:DNA-binding CsgD family transcriptional regulator